MPLWPDIAAWRGPTPNTSGSIADHMYVVVHTADGSFEGTIAWQRNASADVSSHFVVAKDGRIAQMLDTNSKPWTQKAGNPYSISIENEGNENTPLTPYQVEANARILAKAHQVHGVPLQLTGKVGTRGLGHHSMGAESGVDWGHSLCPGSIIKGQKPAILARAKEIVSGVSAAAALKETETMIYTAIAVPAGAVDVIGTPMVNKSRCLVTPNGPFVYQYDEIIAWFNANGGEAGTVTMTWPRLWAACHALAQDPIDVAALATDLASHYPQHDIDQAVILAALNSADGQAALVQAANVAEDS